MKKTVYLSLLTKFINLSNKGLILSSVLISAIVSNAQTTVTFSTPGATTWVVPACVTSITVQEWAGGGGGGAAWSRIQNGCSSSCQEACSQGGGGGGGGFVSRTYTVVPGDVYNITVGAGGLGGTATNVTNGALAGSNGGNSSFSGPATVLVGAPLIALGGTGGGAGNTYNTDPYDWGVHWGNDGAGGTGGGGSGGTTTFTGGNGSSGRHSGSCYDASGAGGGGAGTGANGSPGAAPASCTTRTGGAGGATGGGNGANGGRLTGYNISYQGQTGLNAAILGGGGGGAMIHNNAAGGTSHRNRFGGDGGRGEVRITYTAAAPSTPTISSSAPTCSAAGSSTISNYNAAYTYNFTPAGPTVGAGGVISGMVAGTNYTVTANNGSCSSTATANFSNAPTLTTPTIPTLSSTAPTCSAAGSSTISNYNASLTYNFSPAGPTVGAGGVITGMAVGTTYQVTANNGSCSSTNSVDFSNSAMLPSPSTPTISSSAPTCSAAGSSTISNYNASLTYNFTPAGPTVGAGGVISGMVTGTNYTVTANNGSCNSTATANFNNAPTLTTPTIPTLSSTAPTCSAAGSSTVSNYNAALTYNFTPAGPTVGAGGVISGMVTGTTYQVTASNGSCSSTNSVDFSNGAILPSPAVPTISSTAPSCSAAGSSTISNYNAALSYNFTPAGPTVGAGGVISGMVTGTNYTVTANNGSCNSSATANFSNAPTLTVPSTPTLNSTAPTCSSAGTSTISNYNAALTYIFSPAGPTVGAGGVISGMVTGTTYQVTTSNGSCSSTNSVDFSNSAMLPSPAVPTISSTAPSCSAAGSSTISNYNAALTYNFTPAGPTVGAGGVISGMVTGTNYTVTANNGSCSSTATANFSNAPTLTTPTIPTLSSTAPTCSAAGSSTISNYNASLTYNFSPAGPTVGAGGVITGMAVGTTYQVTANNGSCSSTNSVDFSNSAMLPSPSTPTISSSAPTCSAAGSSTISNYNASLTYNFTPAGPTVGAGGVISGMVAGTNYTVTANNGSCSSTATANFSNADILPSPIVTASSSAVCENGVITLTPTTGGTWVSNNTGVATVTAGGVVTIVNNGSVDFTFTATNTCTATTPTVLVNPEDNSSFNYTSNTHCLTGVDPIATVTGTAGGTFAITSPGVINATTGEIDLSASGLGTFTVYYNTAAAGNPCPSIDSTIINITSAPSADFSYNVAQACQDATAPILSFGVGASAGVFSSTPAGLTLNTSNGAITLSTSTPGVYTVYNTIAASGGCAAALDSTTIEVLQIDDATFNYATGGTYCLTGTDPIATITGTAGGTFTITTPGVINATTGEIDLSASGLGTFTVTYDTPSGNACPQQTTTVIDITDAPTVGFSYNVAQSCQDATNPVLTMDGGATVGVFSSSPTGLTLNTTNGDITLSTSTPGVYTVYNTIAAAGGCAQAVDSTTIEILQLDDATFNYATGGTYCLTGTDPVATVTGTTGGTFTITTPGVINATTGEVDLSASGLGTFTVTYNTPSGNACPQLDSTIINIVNAPDAAFTYATPFCQDNGTALPTFVGNNFAGIFSTNPAGVVFVSTSTGEIDLTSSTPGTYTVYNNLAASGGCAAALDSFVITINPSFNLQETVSVCSGGSYTFPDGTTQTNITTQVLYNSNLTTTLGCDSIIETTVNVDPVIFIQETVSVCSGGSYTFPDGTTQTNITTQVIYNSNLTTISGCDSIVETTVNVNPTFSTQETVSVCSGGSYTFPDGTTQTNITTQVVYTSNLTTTLGCDSIIETTVNIDSPLSIVADPVAPICFGENLILTATGSGNGTVTWYSDATGTNVIGTGSPFNATAQVSTTGLFTFYVNEAGTCPSALTAVNVIVGGVTASINATPTSGFMPLDVVFDNNSSTGPTVSYTWVFGDGTANSNQFEPTHTYSNLGNYTAVLIVTDGVCFDTAAVNIEVIGQSTILIPNVFTPNNDGSNDVFTVDGTNLESVEGQIFNRWGQKLYEWNSVKGSWDGRTQAGTEVPDGTYFYIIKAKGMDGEEYFKTGACTLIR